MDVRYNRWGYDFALAVQVIHIACTNEASFQEMDPDFVKPAYIVSEERFELSTNGLKGHCSAIELLAHLAHLLSCAKHSNTPRDARQPIKLIVEY